MSTQTARVSMSLKSDASQAPMWFRWIGLWAAFMVFVLSGSQFSFVIIDDIPLAIKVILLTGLEMGMAMLLWIVCSLIFQAIFQPIPGVTERSQTLPKQVQWVSGTITLVLLFLMIWLFPSQTKTSYLMAWLCPFVTTLLLALCTAAKNIYLFVSVRPAQHLS